jgi:hypothetical protein
MRLLSTTSGAWALCCVALAVGTPRALVSQGMDCGQLRPFAVARGVDPVYEPAMELAQELRRRGFVVKCVVRSQRHDEFDGQAGAAVFLTDQGRFDALFLTPPQRLDGLVIAERRERGRYIYNFEGRPTPWRPGDEFNSARPVYFVKDAHRLFIVGDEAFAARLRRAFAPRQQR